MSIVTKTGDDGTTGLMYNRRVSKCDPRVEAYGCVDELNASLGLARATAADDFVSQNLLRIQKELVILMGELATDERDADRYSRDGFSRVTKEFTQRLEELAAEIEGQKISFAGWATPGATMNSAALDAARTVGRRAERRIWGLREAGVSVNSEILVYLNRLSDVLWLFARWVEFKESGRPKEAEA